MIKRQPHNNEVEKLESSDKKTVFSIRKRDDGNFEFFVECLKYDEDEELYYWSQEMLPRPHIFGSVIDTKAEIMTQFGNTLISN